ncbi:MAG: hypothetical protein Pg6A_20350 [Termitinemataceae bacterium]|nr:MAG: hypothetical protein Pg6A_20350 [Termitinemataceae bacterium]
MTESQFQVMLTFHKNNSGGVSAKNAGIPAAEFNDALQTLKAEK